MLILILIKSEFVLIVNVLEQWFLLGCLERKHLLPAGELLSGILVLLVQSTCPSSLSLIDFYNGFKQCLDIGSYLIF